MQGKIKPRGSPVLGEEPRGALGGISAMAESGYAADCASTSGDERADVHVFRPDSCTGGALPFPLPPALLKFQAQCFVNGLDVVIRRATEVNLPPLVGLDTDADPACRFRRRKSLHSPARQKNLAQSHRRLLAISVSTRERTAHALHSP